MKKNKLVIDYDFDFTLVGIISSAKGYKLAWEIGKQLGVKLVRKSDLLVGYKDVGDVTFAHYSREGRLNQLKLFRNKSSGLEPMKFLVPEYPHFDFVLLQQPAVDGSAADELVDHLRQLSSIEMVSPIPVAKLKSRTNFIF